MSDEMHQEPGGVSSKPFDGIRFVLLGFDYDTESEVSLKLVSGGGDDVRSYSPDCTHVIVDKCVYEDPTCVAARRDGKIVVTALWVDHSYDIGMPVDHTSVIYRPMKDLIGIPGAKNLVICLTGYQRQDREDIMIMVSLMGAEFSKPLVASRATHLICYKFEGEKYELAKKIPTIKLVNHTWLEDCLNSWELLPEKNYAKSGYELEMEAEVKDSEEEENNEGSITKQFNGRNNTVYFDTRVMNGAVSKLPPTHSISKVSLTTAATIKIDSTKETKVICKDDEAKIIAAICDNNLDLVIDASSNDVVKNENSNPSIDFVTAKKGLEPICPDIGEKSEYPVSSPCNEKKNASSDPLCSDTLKSLNTTHAMETSQRLSMRKDLFKETSCSDKQSGKLQGSDPLASVSEIGLKSESGYMKTSKATSIPRKEVVVNIVPSKRKQGDTCDSGIEPKSSRASKIPVVHTDNIEVTLPEHLPGINGDNPEVHNIINSSKAITVEKSIPDIMTSSPGLMPAKSEDPHRARLSTKGIQKTISKTRLTLESGSSCSGDRKADDRTDKNLMSSEYKNLKSNSRGKKGAGKKITGLTLPEHLPGINGDNSEVHNIINLSKAITVEKSIPDIMTSSPGLMPAKSEDLHRARLSTKGIQKTISKTRLNLESGSSCSGDRKADDRTDKNLMNSEYKNLKSNSRGKKGAGKKITGSNRSSKAPFYDIENGKPKESHMFVEDSDKPIAKPSQEKTNKDSVGTRAKSLTKGVSEKFKFTATKSSSMEASIGEEKCNTADADTFPKFSSNKAMSDSLVLERLDSFCFIKDFEGACCPRDDETEDPQRINELEANTTRAEIKDKEIDSDLQLGDNSGQNSSGLTPSFPGVVECNVIDKTAQQNEPNRSAKKVNAKRDKSNHGTKNIKKSKKMAKTTAGIEKTEDSRADMATAEITDGTGVKTNERTFQIPNSSAEKYTVAANRLEDALESEKENRPLLDYVEIEKMNERILHQPNSNAQNIAAEGNKPKNTPESEKENRPLPDPAANTSFAPITGSENTSISGKRMLNVFKTYLTNKVSGQKFSKNEMKFFLLSGHRSVRNELKKMIRQLKGRLCRDSHHWSYQATHFIVPNPVRTEKFFAAAASGRWILKPDYITDSLKAGKFLDEEPYEWYVNNNCQVGKVDLVAPRKWRILREQTGHGAFHGMRIIVYGDFFCPPLDTLKRVVKAGDGIVLATAPPYTRFLGSQVDFAIISQGTPEEDVWVQEFLKHEIPCVAIDYLVEFVCIPGCPTLKRHVMFETDLFAEKSFVNMVRRSEEIIEDVIKTEEEDLKCNVCGSSDRGEHMLICGDEEGSIGCGIGTHADCCDPPLEEIPEDDWFCSNCSNSNSKVINKSKFVKSK